MTNWICVSSFHYELAFPIFKLMKSLQILYKFDCTIHPNDGFQLLIPQNEESRLREIQSKTRDLEINNRPYSDK